MTEEERAIVAYLLAKNQKFDTRDGLKKVFSKLLTSTATLALQIEVPEKWRAKQKERAQRPHVSYSTLPRENFD